MRTACYARFSSDLQRDTSLDDQIRGCHDYADQHGWTWQATHVYTDAAISGASIEGRPGLRALLTAAAMTPRPFDVLLVDDSSRVARDLADALRIVQRLRFAGVRVVYISQGIDSDSEQHETLIAVHGLVDGLYLREMAAKIRRGLAGQIGRGYATGGVTYGYRTVRLPDPARPDQHLGYRVEIEPTEAAAVRQIFEWSAEGLTFTRIIAALRAAGAPAPRGGYSHGDWRLGAVRRVLENQRYRGRLIWGRSRVERNPGTQRKVQRPVSPDAWHVVERPDLRIVSDELWHRVQSRRQHRSADLATHRQPGRTLLRGRSGLTHGTGLFAGLLRCGECGRSVGIVTRRVYRGREYAYLGCAISARNGVGVCGNRVTVRREDAERALLAGVQAEVSRPETVAYIVDRLSAALQQETATRPEQRHALLQQRESVEQKIRHLLTAVESGMASPSLYQALSARERELAHLHAELATLDARAEPGPLTVMPTWVQTQLTDVVALLQDEPARARAELQRLGVRFTLHPVFDVPEGQRPYLRAVGEGNFEALVGAGDKDFTFTGRSHLR